MPSKTNDLTTVRFLDINETVSRNIKKEFQEESSPPLLLPLLKKIAQQAEDAGYKTKNASNLKIYARFNQEELFEVGCTIDSVSDSSNIGDLSSSSNVKNGNTSASASPSLTYTKREPNSVRCAHLRYTSDKKYSAIAASSSSSGANDDDDGNNKEEEAKKTAADQEQEDRDLAYAFQSAFSASLKQFVNKFKENADAELIAEGSFYVVFSSSSSSSSSSCSFSDADFYAVLANDPPPVPIILDHDGGVDDLVALLVLASASVKPLTGMARRFELLGTTIVDADCFKTPTGELCRRLFCMFGAVSKTIPNLPVGVSPLEGTAYPFPDEWRKDCLAMLDFPCLHTAAVDEAMQNRPDEIDGTGHELLGRLVMESPRPVTIVVTGPLTNVAYCLDKYGEAFAKNIREISIMGGAVHVPGNVINADLPKTAHAVDKSAEWNIYWDAPAAKKVLESPLIKNKLLYSLDATNHVPVTSALVRRFGKVTHQVKNVATQQIINVPTELSVFCGNSWAMCTWLGFMLGDERGYFAWDVLCAVGVLSPTIAKYEEVKITVDADSKSVSEGRTKPDEEKGAPCHVALTIDAEAFYKLVLESAALF